MSLAKLLDLKGRIALVTGGSRGLGLQIGEALGEMGAKLAITARKKDELDGAVRHLDGLGIEAIPLICDLADSAGVAPMVEDVLAAYGRIDILVNNAATTWGAPMIDHPLAGWKKVMDLNLTGAFLVTQAVGKLSMVPRRQGKIINVASVGGIVGVEPAIMTAIAYGTSKGGMVHFTRALAAEWAQYNINVNAIAPSWFLTRMSRGTLEAAGDEVIARTPLRRLGGDEDLKGLAAVLASDAGSYITGQVIAVDGGLTAI